MRCFLVAFVAAVSLVSGGLASALEPSPAPDSSLPAEPSAQTELGTKADSEAHAAELYRDAEAKYIAGDLSGALTQMRRSYEVSGLTELLFNVAQLQQELEHCEAALATYREYLARNAQPSRSTEATSAIAELSRKCPERPSVALIPVAKSVSPTPATLTTALPPAPRTYWTPMRTVGWSAIAASVLAGSAAAYLAVEAANDEKAMEQRLREIRASQAGFDDADKQRENAGQRAATWAQVLGVSAAGFATAGVTLLVIGEKQETRAAAFSLELGGGSLGARYSRPF